MEGKDLDEIAKWNFCEWFFLLKASEYMDVDD